MFEVIQNITTVISLLAFFAAVFAYVAKFKLSESERLILGAKEEDRAELVRNLLGAFSINASNLTKKDQYNLAMAQIHERSARYNKGLVFLFMLALLFGTLATFLIYKSPDEKAIRGKSHNKVTAETTKPETKKVSIHDRKRAIKNLRLGIQKLFDDHHDEGRAIRETHLKILPKSVLDFEKFLTMGDPESWAKIQKNHKEKFNQSSTHQDDLEVLKIGFIQAFPELAIETKALFKQAEYWHKNVAHKKGEALPENALKKVDFPGLKKALEDGFEDLSQLEDIGLDKQRSNRLRKDIVLKMDRHISKFRVDLYLSYEEELELLEERFRVVQEKMSALIKLASEITQEALLKK